ncbi:hypothetical protein PPERSA_05868 [Pseudocohnilembus persalinus]|uniref:Uncharacterized protein n=1 Tax=Pseudocohnilembus persalinus TaxID=266149 RepID=A0A0V0R3Z5_PSEPJ|nr:hypothetical protein PPERSA_05868 [Pseudocohnilembus persalinus]|eukprot:KRX09199.1 hypothetical protein PPERSA_05868 [Pseudocohnilembus persalinus]
MYEKNEYWLKGKQRNIEVIKALLEEKQKQEESQYSFKPDIKKIKPSEVAPQYRTKSGVNNHIKRQIQARIQRESIKEKLNGYSSTQKLQTYSSIKENPQNIIKNQTSMKSLVSSKSSSTLKKQFTVPNQPKFNQKQKLQEIPCLQYPYHPLSSRGSHNKQEERYLVPEQFISDFEEKQSKYSQDLDKLNNEYYVIQQQEDMQEMKYTNAQEYLRNQLLSMDI